MTRCEMCGTQSDDLYRVKIEGAELDVCDNCSNLGTRVDSDEGETEKSEKTHTETDRGRNTADEIGPSRLVLNYGEVIRQARLSAGHSPEKLANLLNEKESVIKRVENEEMQPDNTLQAKLEQFLGIELSADINNDGSYNSGMNLDPDNR